MGIEEAASLFRIPGPVTGVRSFGSGHIHNTYAVSVTGSDEPQFLLQEINTHVFRDVPGMMRNIALVTKHLGRKLEETENTGFQTLSLIRTREDNDFLWHEERAWRMYRFLGGYQSFNILPTEKAVQECGRGYGKFIRLLSDLNADELVVTIPRFHEIGYRLEQLEEARKHTDEDSNGLYDLVYEMAETMAGLDAMPVPVRVTHNDTKSNNILFDDMGRAACVVDLDTVMPGKLWYDTGDSLRSILNNEDSDDRQPDIRADYYQAYLRGFLGETQSLLTAEEWECIPLSGAYMAYIMGVRFLTDHLNGDIYYKTTYRGHNLKRAGNQLALAYSLWGMEGELREMMEGIRSEISRK